MLSALSQGLLTGPLVKRFGDRRVMNWGCMGVLMSLTSLMAIINPLIMTTLFAATSSQDSAVYLPGSPYFLGSALFLISWLLILRWESKHPEHVVGKAVV